MDNQTYQQIIGEIGTLISIFAPLLTAYKIALKFGLDNYIESKIGLIKDDNLRKVAENIKIRVENLAINTITMLEVVEKPQIISAIESGTMTKDDLKTLKTKAIETIKGQLTTQGQTDLKNTVGDINSYLDTLVEAKLAQLKVDPTSPVKVTEIKMPTQEQLDNDSLKNQLIQVQSQLQQIQTDKDNLVQQLGQEQESRRQSEQSWQELANQVSSLTTEKQQLEVDKQDLQNKLNTITNTLSSVVQPSVNQTIITDNANVAQPSQTVIQ